MSQLESVRNLKGCPRCDKGWLKFEGTFICCPFCVENERAGIIWAFLGQFCPKPTAYQKRLPHR
jgi:hypothetical protein